MSVAVGCKKEVGGKRMCGSCAGFVGWALAPGEKAKHKEKESIHNLDFPLTLFGQALISLTYLGLYSQTLARLESHDWRPK